MSGFTPYAWQAREVLDNALAPKRALFAQPRLGKTKATTDSLDVVWPTLPRKSGIVVAPTAVCPIWTDELLAHGYTVHALYTMPLKGTVNYLKAHRDGIIVVNYDRLVMPVTPKVSLGPDVLTGIERTKPGKPLIDFLRSWGPCAVIVDESHNIVAPRAPRARAVRRLCWEADWVRLLTGTPVPNHYGNLWGQMVALDRNEWGTSYGDFARKYLILDSMFPSRVIAHRHDTIEELATLLRKYATVVNRRDVFGPDQWIIVNRKVTLPPKALKVYTDLARKWFFSDDEAEVSAEHVLRRLARLQQVAAGYVPDDSGEKIHLLHTAKIDAVRADLGEIVYSDEKAVIFSRFTWEVDTYAELAASMGVPYWKIDASVPADERHAIGKAFRETHGAAIVVAQTRTMGVGVSFAAAEHILFTSESFSYAEQEQARDRVYAVTIDGKPVPRTAHYYRAEGTVDYYIADCIARKRVLDDSVRSVDRNALVFGRVT